MVMERWNRLLSFNFKNSFLLRTKGVFVKVSSRLRYKAKDDRNGLVSVYKDMEACGGYRDIQVMWEMIHSSSSPSTPHTIQRKKPSHNISLCFNPT